MTARQELMDMFESECKRKYVPFNRQVVETIIEIYIETDIEISKPRLKERAPSDEAYEQMVDLIVRLKKELN